MQNLKLPRRSRIAGLYLYCNKCKSYYSSDAKVKCKCDSLVYRAKIHITGTKNKNRIKTLKATSFEDAFIEMSGLKKVLIDSNFNLAIKSNDNATPILLLDCMADYMGYLNNEGVPEHKKKVRSSGHIKDYERNFKYYIESLVDKGIEMEALKFIDVNDRCVGYLHNYLLKTKKVKNRYYNNIISALRIFTTHIIKTYKLDYTNPFVGVKRRYVKYEPKSVSDNDFYKLLKAVNKENGYKTVGTKGERKNFYRDWMVDAFWLGLYTGGRGDEVVDLKWSDIVYDEKGMPSHFSSNDYKFNRSHSDIVSHDEKKNKQFIIYNDFKTFLDRIGHDKYKYSNHYILAPGTVLKRKTMIGLISKAFTQFMSKTDIKEKLVFKNLRKTFSSSVRFQYGDLAHYITGHEVHR